MLTRRLRAIRRVAVLLLAGACSDGNSPEPQSGEVEGEVHLLGELAEPPSSGVVQLYASLEAVDQREAFREAPLIGGPADWIYRLEEVPVGTYYLGACFPFGCGTYSDIEGQPVAVAVAAGEATTAVMAF
jgi:hypothetical protein